MPQTPKVSLFKVSNVHLLNLLFNRFSSIDIELNALATEVKDLKTDVADHKIEVENSPKSDDPCVVKCRRIRTSLAEAKGKVQRELKETG